MKDKEYNKLIGRIKATKPEPDDVQGLTAEIMSSVAKLSGKPKPTFALKIVSWSSSVAAVLLLGALLWENSTQTALSTQRAHAVSLTGLSIEKANTMDEIDDIVREKRERKKDREAFYTSIMSDERELFIHFE